MSDVCLFIIEPLVLVQCDITCYCIAYLQIISALLGFMSYSAFFACLILI